MIQQFKDSLVAAIQTVPIIYIPHFHFSYIDEIIEDILSEKKGKRYFNFFESDYHTDYVFGDDSISVEAETKGKQKILLMDKGRWKI